MPACLRCVCAYVSYVCVHTCISLATQVCVCVFTCISLARVAKYIPCHFYFGMHQRWCRAREATPPTAVTVYLIRKGKRVRPTRIRTDSREYVQTHANTPKLIRALALGALGSGKAPPLHSQYTPHLGTPNTHSHTSPDCYTAHMCEEVFSGVECRCFAL